MAGTMTGAVATLNVFDLECDEEIGRVFTMITVSVTPRTHLPSQILLLLNGFLPSEAMKSLVLALSPSLNFTLTKRYHGSISGAPM